MPPKQTYLIEIRVLGRMKYDVINLINSIGRKFRIQMPKTVPHITVMGAFDAPEEHEGRLIADFIEACSEAGKMDYETEEYGTFPENGALFLTIKKNLELEAFRLGLREKLQKYCNLCYWDFNPDFMFHTTIATRVDRYELDDMLNYAKQCRPLAYKAPVLRIALLKDGRVLTEYDFILERPISMDNLDDVSESKAGIMKYYSEQNESDQANQRIFFVSDLHLGDTAQINTCSRPFRNTDTMNNVLISNWNAEITDKDTVFFLGDLATFDADIKEYDDWLHQLNGKITIVRGDNDMVNTEDTSFLQSIEVEICGKHFYITHNPLSIPESIKNNPDVWIIHGHTQNRMMEEYPYINHETRTVNVSVDVTSYRPTQLEEIVKAIDGVHFTEPFTCS